MYARVAQCVNFLYIKKKKEKKTTPFLRFLILKSRQNPPHVPMYSVRSKKQVFKKKPVHISSFTYLAGWFCHMIMSSGPIGVFIPPPPSFSTSVLRTYTLYMISRQASRCKEEIDPEESPRSLEEAEGFVGEVYPLTQLAPGKGGGNSSL